MWNTWRRSSNKKRKSIAVMAALASSARSRKPISRGNTVMRADVRPSPVFYTTPMLPSFFSGNGLAFFHSAIAIRRLLRPFLVHTPALPAPASAGPPAGYHVTPARRAFVRIQPGPVASRPSQAATDPGCVAYLAIDGASGRDRVAVRSRLLS